MTYRGDIMSEFNANPQQFQGPFQPQQPMPPRAVYVPSDKIATKAARTARLIGGLKVVMLVLNALGSVI